MTAEPVQRTTADDRHPLRGERHWSREAPDGPWDVVVVGSGIGGLTAAALLVGIVALTSSRPSSGAMSPIDDTP